MFAIVELPFHFLNELNNQLMSDLFSFLPEVVLCLGIVGMLVLRLFSSGKRSSHSGYVALAIVAFSLLITIFQGLGASGIGLLSPDEVRPDRTYLGIPTNTFTGLLVYDYFTWFLRLFLFSFTILTIWLTLITGIPDREDSADFYVLLLGAVLGMSIMASANHFLMLFIGIEMASLPSYALAGFLKGRRKSSEAALKYVVYGGGAAGVMLYGMSLLAGKFGTGYLPQVAAAFTAAMIDPAGGLIFDPILVLGMLFIFIGIAFKLAAVPFHFWCPDVFEGASAEVAAFLSVASKGAALALLARIAMYLGAGGFAHYVIPTIATFAIVTATFGNLAAFWQNNLKRLLAYSTIAQAGYLMMGIAVVNAAGNKAMLFYLIGYLITNLGAFAIVAFIRNQTGSEDLSGYRGLVARSPLMVITLSVCLLSLLGIPPLIGFAAKFQVFAVLFQSAKDHGAAGQSGLSTTLYVTLVLGLINSVVSAVYYFKVMKVMILDKTVEQLEGREVTPLRSPIGSQVYAAVMALGILVTGLAWGPLSDLSEKGVSHWKRPPAEDSNINLLDRPPTPIPRPGGGPQP